MGNNNALYLSVHPSGISTPTKINPCTGSSVTPWQGYRYHHHSHSANHRSRVNPEPLQFRPHFTGQHSPRTKYRGHTQQHRPQLIETTRPTDHAAQITATSKQLTLKKFSGKTKKHKTLLDNAPEVGHNKDAATNKPRTRWETGNQ